ncbi:MAG: DUF58 domain-containing protein [Deltaproteobacteria bacterium]|nr:DUF58 domain-containing protein [Deltaproteobacteria bacterium]
MTPSPRLVLLVALAALPALATLVTPDAYPISGAVDVALAIALVAALVRRLPADAVRVERAIEPVQFVRGEARVRVRMANASGRRLHVEIRDLPPPEVECDGLPLRATLAPGEEAELSYRVRFPRRGRHRFGDLWCRASAPLGLLQFDTRTAQPTEVKVYPAPLASGGGALAVTQLTRDSRGAGRMRLVGEGAELEGLRTFVQGDDPRLIDWKVSARRGRVVVREMRPERNQRLVLMIDLGRALHPALGVGTKLDRVVEAAHELAVLAIEGGDEVGLVAFGAGVRARLPLARGAAHARTILDTLLELRSEPVEPLYPEAFAALAGLVTRRALVVLFTDVTDPGSSRTIVSGLAGLRPRHLPMCVTVADSALRAVANAPSADVDQVLRKVAARELLADQRRALGMLEARGVLTVHVPADRLAAATLERYLHIKHRAML